MSRTRTFQGLSLEHRLSGRVPTGGPGYPSRMRGAVAAGHPLTAQAGADVLAAGGNAVDAAVGAALVSWIAESPLTGPGAGGFMLVHRARDRSTRVFDFFVAVPGLGLANADLAEMDRVEVDFSGGSTQVFHIGAASCAVPGAAIGLEEAHRSPAHFPGATSSSPRSRSRGAASSSTMDRHICTRSST